jgi:hypothetical protein
MVSSELSPEMMTGSILYVSPGEPYLGEAVMHLLLAFNSEPNKNAKYPPREREHAQIAIALIMVARESVIKNKLFMMEKDEDPDSGKEENVFLKTTGYPKERAAFILWQEVRILRNQIIHNAYFEQSTKGGKISIATKNRLVGSDKKYIDLHDECTKQWRLNINPLNVSRYEALVCFLLFYWYGKETGVWTSNKPLLEPHVDCRMKHKIHDCWITRNDYQALIGEGKDFGLLIGFLSGRLPGEQRERFFNLVADTFNIDMKDSLRLAKDIIKMSGRQKLDFD